MASHGTAPSSGCRGPGGRTRRRGRRLRPSGAGRLRRRPRPGAPAGVRENGARSRALGRFRPVGLHDSPAVRRRRKPARRRARGPAHRRSHPLRLLARAVPGAPRRPDSPRGRPTARAAGGGGSQAIGPGPAAAAGAASPQPGRAFTGSGSGARGPGRAVCSRGRAGEAVAEAPGAASVRRRSPRRVRRRCGRHRVGGRPAADRGTAEPAEAHGQGLGRLTRRRSAVGPAPGETNASRRPGRARRAGTHAASPGPDGRPGRPRAAGGGQWPGPDREGRGATGTLRRRARPAGRGRRQGRLARAVRGGRPRRSGPRPDRHVPCLACGWLRPLAKFGYAGCVGEGLPSRPGCSGAPGTSGSGARPERVPRCGGPCPRRAARGPGPVAAGVCPARRVRADAAGRSP